MVQKLSKRIKGVAAFVLAVTILLLSACSSGRTVQAKTYYYTLFTENGQWFMEVRSARVKSDIDRNTAKEIIITSPGDLRDKIMNGDFPAAYICDYVQRPPFSNYTIQICNLDRLYDLCLPKGLHYDGIDWYGDSYRFSVPIDGAIYGTSFYCASQEDYLRLFDYYFREQFQNNILQDTTDGQGTRDVYTLSLYSLDHYKIYILQTPSQTLHVCEHRRYNDYSGRLNEVNAIFLLEAANPKIETTIFGTDGSYYFYGYLPYSNERPTEQWLSSFALVPYQGD